jgi:thiol-disulfide isomerase/thioredoxin
MAQTPSTMLALGTALPPFSLTDPATGKTVRSSDVRGAKGTLVMFICNHCPFVKHVMPELGRLARDYTPKGIGIVAINSNDVEAYPQDGPDAMKELATSEGWTFPFLLDDTQDVAAAYQAACTPDFFLFDGAGTLAYRGRLDESRPQSGVAPTGRDLRAALDALIAGGAPASDQQPSIGCNIKWKVGKAPVQLA